MFKQLEVPNTLIIGAMKAGTTALHRILGQHPEVYLSQPKELFFFDYGDCREHPKMLDKNYCLDEDWNSPANMDWYLNKFADRGKQKIVGEATPTYLSSKKAPARIASTLKNPKLIVMLRDPVERTYSHYLHMVRFGEAVFSFQDMLKFSPRELLFRSFYKESLERYLKYFDRNQIHLIIFERFIEKPEETLHSLCRFLGIDANYKFKVKNPNKGKAPWIMRLSLLYNYFISTKIQDIYDGRHPEIDSTCKNLGLLIDQGIRKLLNLRKRKPPMDPLIRDRLINIFQAENEGLSDIIGEKIPEWSIYNANS